MENEKLTYINSRGERLELGVDSVYHCNISKDVEGISGVTSVIYSTNSMGQHGDTYVGQRIEARDIDVVGHINTRDKAQALELRRRMLKIFNPELSATLVYEYGGFKRVIDCRAYGEPKILKKEVLYEFDLQIECLNPFWREEEETKEDIASWVAAWHFPCVIEKDSTKSMIYGYRAESVIVDCYNEGDVSTGMRIRFTALGTVSNPILLNVDTEEFIQINATMKTGDVIEINTKYGSKGAKLIRDGVETDYFRYIDVDSTFMQLTRYLMNKYGVPASHVIRHYDVTGKICPNPYVYNTSAHTWDEFKRKISGQAETPQGGNEKTIWNFLTGKGLNAYAVAGIMGNLYAESGLMPNNLQNTYNNKLGKTDAEYTAAVDNGSYGNFVKDSAGYGLAQWTYWSRKQALLNHAKQAGVSIADLNMQLGFLWEELQGYTAVMDALKKAGSVRAASDAVLTGYEKPADQSETVKKKRAEYGEGYYKKYAAGNGTKYYRVRKSWTDAASQLGAFTSLENAKSACKAGYTVYDDNGKAVYTAAGQQTSAGVPFSVQVDILDLNIRTGAGTNYAKTGETTGKGVFTIVEVKAGQGASVGWGRLKSGAGWISLDYATRLA